MITKEFYQNRFETMLHMWKTELDRLMGQEPEFKKVEYENQLNLLVARQNEAEGLLQEFKQMGHERWGEHGLKMEKMLYSLHEAFEPLWSRSLGQRPN